jgi:hypothetical protein
MYKKKIIVHNKIWLRFYESTWQFVPKTVTLLPKLS